MKNSVASSSPNLFGPVHASPIWQATELIQSHLDSVEEKIRQQSRVFDPAIEEYVSYVVTKGGKRLRPTLALLAGGVTGNITTSHVELAVILELIHIATLVHDDIIDGADLRRDQLTANAKWGNALSVLLGDCLFSHALRLSTNFSDREVSRKIADASAEVCSGEIMQTRRRFDLHLSIADYYRIIEMKTAALFAVACELGAFISRATPDIIGSLRKFGYQMGIAYQIYDDCLDLIGDEARVGKTLGTDLRKGKFTLPVLLLIHQENGKNLSTLQSLLGRESVDVDAVVHMASASTAIRMAAQTGLQWIAEAREHLASIPQNRHTLALDAVARHLEMMLAPMK